VKVIIDTNVVVSATFKDRDPELIIFFILKRQDFDWIISSSILEEYESVLARKKFNLPENILQGWSEVFRSISTIVEVDTNLSFPRDQKDAKFLECALAIDADFLITGDTDFSEAKQYGNTKILSVSQFKRLVCDPIFKRLDLE
jgi:uncharacterized protein